MHAFLSKLLGQWQSTTAVGKYPTIKDFNYDEELVFEEHGQPLLSYKSITKINSITKHCESGFLRINPQTGTAIAMEAHNFGLSVVHEGSIDGNKMKLESKEIGRMSSAKEPHVVKIRKIIELVGEDGLRITTDMATTATELTNHLVVDYKRKNI
jgi:hypothetical protein